MWCPACNNNPFSFIHCFLQRRQHSWATWSHKSVSVKSVSRDRLICGFHNSCTGIDSYYFRRKTVFIGCQFVYGINGNILWYDQSDTCFSINLTQEFKAISVLVQVIFHRYRQPSIQKDIWFLSWHRYENRSKVCVLQFDFVTLFFQYHLSQVTHGNTFQPIGISYFHFLFIYVRIRTGNQ